MSSDRPARFVTRVGSVSRVPAWISAARQTQVRTLEPPRLPADLDHVTVHYGPPSSKPPTYQKPHGKEPAAALLHGHEDRISRQPLPSVLPSAPPPSRREHPAQNLQVVQALDQLTRALADLARARAAFLSAAQAQMVELVGMIARRVIRREITLDRGVVQELAREGIDALTVQDRLTIRVGSAFAERVDALRSEFAAYASNVDIDCDPHLDPFGCVVHGDLGSVDETVDARFERLMQALTAAHAEEA